MIRLMSSAITVAANAADVTVESELTGLGDTISSKALVKPLGLLFSGTIPADLVVKRISFRSVKNGENVYEVYRSATAKSLADIAELLKPGRDGGVPITIREFNPDHGLKLVLEGVTNGVTAYAKDIHWRLANRVTNPRALEALQAAYARGAGGLLNSHGSIVAPPPPPPDDGYSDDYLG